MNMKKLLLNACLGLSMLSLTSPLKSNFTLSGNAAGIKDGTMVYLESQDEVLGAVKLDSVKMSKGTFTMKGFAAEPKVGFIQIKGVEGKIAFILDQGAINFTIYKDSISKSKIGGTPDNDALQNFNTFTQSVQKRMQDFQTANAQKNSNRPNEQR